MELTRRRGTNLSPALAASAAMHLGLAALAFISWKEAAKKITISQVVPVTIVNGPAAAGEDATPSETVAAPAAEEPASVPAPPAPAPEPQPPQPAPTPPKPAPPQPAPPQPVPPKPAPPKPAPPKPAPQKAAPTPPAKPPASSSQKPQPSTAAPAKPEPRLNLDQLQQSLQSSVNLDRLQKRLQGQIKNRPSAAPGPTAPASGPPGRLSAGEAGMLQAKLERLWNPNCDVAGATSVTVKVHMYLKPDGRLARPPVLVSRSGSASAEVLDAAADRAVSAAGRGAPYDELPADRYDVWKDIVMTFHAKSACNR